MGWSKLDAEAAARLMDVIASFPPSKVCDWGRALLTLYASLGRDGTTTMGVRTLAKAADVTPKVAQGLVERLERDGVLVSMGQTRGAGTYERRRFSWAYPPDGNEGTPVPSKGTPCTRRMGPKGTPLYPQPNRNGTQQRCTESTYHVHSRAQGKRGAPAPLPQTEAPLPQPLPPPPPPPRGDR